MSVTNGQHLKKVCRSTGLFSVLQNSREDRTAENRVACNGAIGRPLSRRAFAGDIARNSALPWVIGIATFRFRRGRPSRIGRPARSRSFKGPFKDLVANDAKMLDATIDRRVACPRYPAGTQPRLRGWHRCVLRLWVAPWHPVASSAPLAQGALVYLICHLGKIRWHRSNPYILGITCTSAAATC